MKLIKCWRTAQVTNKTIYQWGFGTVISVNNWIREVWKHENFISASVETPATEFEYHWISKDKERPLVKLMKLLNTFINTILFIIVWHKSLKRILLYDIMKLDQKNYLPQKIVNILFCGSLNYIVLPT